MFYLDFSFLGYFVSLPLNEPFPETLKRNTPSANGQINCLCGRDLSSDCAGFTFVSSLAASQQLRVDVCSALSL